jgi:dienelactone hydrolase
MSATPRWLGAAGAPLLGWVTPGADAGAGPRTGAVVLPPVGYEYWSTHRTLRTLAERLGAFGVATVRVDHFGTGDSAGTAGDEHMWEAWRAGAAAGATELRRAGCVRIVLIGVRLGGTLALLDGSSVGADAVAVWAPVTSGRRYVRELRMLGQTVPGTEDDATPSIALAGTLITGETLEELGRLGPASIGASPAARVLVVDRPDRKVDTGVLDRLRALGSAAEHLTVAGGESALDRPTEYATVPTDLVEVIASWTVATGRTPQVGTSQVGPPQVGPSQVGTAEVGVDDIGPLGIGPFGVGAAGVGATATFDWAGGRVTEDVVTVGPDRLVGVRARPAAVDPAAPGPVVVWLNTGSEHHVGPGRAWTELTRDLALLGWTSVRVDFSGFGESPDAGHAPGRPYDAHTVDEAGRLVTWLAQDGHPSVLVGLCASAWVALRVAAYGTGIRPAGVFAVNPQLYWRPGDPVEADIAAETHVRRLGEIARWHRLRSLGVWTALDMLGVRHPAGGWLRRLATGPTPVLALFADGDDGLVFLEDRVRRAWRRARRSGRVTLVVDRDLDHGLHRRWHRHRLVDALAPWLESTLGRPTAPGREAVPGAGGGGGAGAGGGGGGGAGAGAGAGAAEA